MKNIKKSIKKFLREQKINRLKNEIRYINAEIFLNKRNIKYYKKKGWLKSNYFVFAEDMIKENKKLKQRKKILENKFNKLKKVV